MARKANKRHIKSLAAPVFFGVERKKNKYVSKPIPGTHSKERSVSVELALKRVGLVKSRMEAVRLLKDGAVAVNSKKINNVRYPVGFSDRVEVGKESFAIGIDKHGVISIEKEKGGAQRVMKVVGKYKTKNGEVRIRLHDGTTLNIGSEPKINDSVRMEKGGAKLITLREGSSCFVIGGVHVGSSGKIASVKEGTRNTEKSVKIETGDGKSFETLAKNIIVTS